MPRSEKCIGCTFEHYDNGIGVSFCDRRRDLPCQYTLPQDDGEPELQDDQDFEEYGELLYFIPHYSAYPTDSWE